MLGRIQHCGRETDEWRIRGGSGSFQRTQPDSVPHIPLWYSPIKMMGGFYSLWTPFVTALVALYAAFLSTLHLLWNLWRMKRRVKVTLRIGAHPHGVQVGRPCVLLCAVNSGSRAVALNGFGLYLPDGRELGEVQSGFLSTIPLSQELADGGGCTAWLDAERLALSLNERHMSGEVKLRGFYRNTLGKEYKSKTLIFHIEQNLPHPET